MSRTPKEKKPSKKNIAKEASSQSPETFLVCCSVAIRVQRRFVEPKVLLKYFLIVQTSTK
jgi:hypothetical protein